MIIIMYSYYYDEYMHSNSAIETSLIYNIWKSDLTTKSEDWLTCAVRCLHSNFMCSDCDSCYCGWCHRSCCHLSISHAMLAVDNNIIIITLHISTLCLAHTVCMYLRDFDFDSFVMGATPSSTYKFFPI